MMGQWLDSLARAVARRMSRRQALKLGAGVATAAVLETWSHDQPRPTAKAVARAVRRTSGRRPGFDEPGD